MARVGWNREINRERLVLARIVATLLALAILASRAASAPARPRREALAFLALGVVEARCMVAGLVGLAPELGEESDADDAPILPGADDAERLAAAFRVLALVVHTMLGAARDSDAGMEAPALRDGFGLSSPGEPDCTLCTRLRQSILRSCAAFLSGGSRARAMAPP